MGSRKAQEGFFIGIFALAAMVVTALAITYLSNRVNDMLRNQGQMVAQKQAYWNAFSGLQIIGADTIAGIPASLDTINFAGGLITYERITHESIQFSGSPMVSSINVSGQDGDHIRKARVTVEPPLDVGAGIASGSWGQTSWTKAIHLNGANKYWKQQTNNSTENPLRPINYPRDNGKTWSVSSLFKLDSGITNKNSVWSQTPWNMIRRVISFTAWITDTETGEGSVRIYIGGSSNVLTNKLEINYTNISGMDEWVSFTCFYDGRSTCIPENCDYGNLDPNDPPFKLYQTSIATGTVTELTGTVVGEGFRQSPALGDFVVGRSRIKGNTLHKFNGKIAYIGVTKPGLTLSQVQGNGNYKNGFALDPVGWMSSNGITSTDSNKVWLMGDGENDTGSATMNQVNTDDTDSKLRRGGGASIVGITIQSQATAKLPACNFALDFDGVDDELSVPDDNSLDLGQDDITLAAWVYPYNIAGNYEIINKKEMGGSGTKGYTYRFADNKIKFSIKTNDGNIFLAHPSPAPELATMEWIHTAVVFDRSGSLGSICLNLDSNKDRLTIRHNSVLNPGSGEFSWSIWFNASTIKSGNNQHKIFSKRLAKVDNYELMIKNKYLNFTFKDKKKSKRNIVSNKKVSTNIWYHVVITRRDQLRMYVSGILQNSKQNVGGYDVSTNKNLILGSDPYGKSKYNFLGLIDHFAIWNTELTAAEVAQLYSGGISMDYNVDSGDYGSGANLRGFWRMDEGSGTSVADASEGYDNTAIFNNTPTWSQMGYPSNYGTVAVYTNGDLYGTKSFETEHESSSTLANDLDLSIGYRKYPKAGGSNHFGGRIDEVSVWSKALNADDIASLFNGDAKRNSGRIAPDELVLYLKFNESIGTTANDETENDNDAELPSDESKRPEWILVDY